MTLVIQVQCVFCEVVAKFLVTVYTIFRRNSVMRKIRTLLHRCANDIAVVFRQN